ncbi:hypothetical protein ACFL4M_00340 [Pseudomonadota bacterium]
MKKMLFSAVAFAVVAVSAVAVAPTTSEAVPAFARQTGAACLNCHFQAIPRLAAFGRNFKMNAYRDTGEQALIEDEHLSLPAVFNASYLMKARFSTGDTKSTTAGVTTVASKGGVIGTPATGSSIAVQFPDESALLFGGRLGEHAGLFNEWDVIGGSMLGAKMAYVFDLDAGIVALAIGTTDALGAPSLFNDPSNAVVRNTRGVQTRARALRSTVMHTGATGVGVYGHLADSLYFAIGGLLGNENNDNATVGGAAGGTAIGNAGVDVTLSPYLRAAYTGELAGMDTVIGAWYAKTSAAAYKSYPTVSGLKNERTEYGIDLQFQGDLGDVSVGFYAPIVLSAKTTFAVGVDEKVTGYMPYVNVAFGPAGVRLGYDYAKTTNVASVLNDTRKDSNFIVGAWYDVAQNLTLDLEINVAKTDFVTAGVTSTSKLTSSTLQIEYVY